ncbi:MAG: hypothetical protein O3A59_04485 [Nitrospirae bacterium]|nr:hypothetical protein [Nitrospirota bacterium]
MQRATLLMSREASIPYQAASLLLPTWFPAVWLARLAKWGTLILIALSWSWGVAAGLLVADFVLAAALPIPYHVYVPAFRKRIVQIKAQDAEVGTALETMLNDSKIHGKGAVP